MKSFSNKPRPEVTYVVSWWHSTLIYIYSSAFGLSTSGIYFWSTYLYLLIGNEKQHLFKQLRLLRLAIAQGCACMRVCDRPIKFLNNKSFEQFYFSCYCSLTELWSVFRIPVYGAIEQNRNLAQPETLLPSACRRVVIWLTSGGVTYHFEVLLLLAVFQMDDCDLEKLSAAPARLTPKFNRKVTEYSATVPSNVEKVKIDALTSDTGASYQIIVSKYNMLTTSALRLMIW